MVKITQDFIPAGNNNRPGYAMTPIYITVHNTANTAVGANAKSHASYVKNPDTPTSWHFTVDDTEIYQHLPLNENGWHAGDGNGTATVNPSVLKFVKTQTATFHRPWQTPNGSSAH